MAAPWDDERAAAIISSHKELEGATLPILHGLQAAFGHIPEQAIQMIASALNLSRAEVYGVFSFYHDFRHTSAGTHVLKLCRAEACQSVGADALAADVQKQLGVAWGNTTADGKVTLEPVFCLGLCACGPAAIVDGKVVGRLNKTKLDTLIQGMQA